jgi:hypothetical protein
MHKNTTKCNKTLSKWCKNKHGASKIIDTFETYQGGADVEDDDGAVDVMEMLPLRKRGVDGVDGGDFPLVATADCPSGGGRRVPPLEEEHMCQLTHKHID